MKRELLIETTASEARIAVLEDDVVVDLIVERDAGASLVGNIYLGRVQRVVTGIAAAFEHSAGESSRGADAKQREAHDSFKRCEHLG